MRVSETDNTNIVVSTYCAVAVFSGVDVILAQMPLVIKGMSGIYSLIDGVIGPS